MPISSFRAFLGRGIVRPFRRDQKSDFANDNGLANVKSCVGQVIGTICADESGQGQGEIPWRPEFGTLLYRLKHRKGHMLNELARVYVIDALARWEPRVVILDIATSFEANTLTIHLIYNVIERNVAGNNVILRDVEQDVSLPVAA